MTSPLVLVERIERDGDRLTAEVRMGGHPGRVVLDFSRRALGLVEHVEMPFLLGLYPVAARVVIALLDRAAHGAVVALPADLSDELRRAARGEPRVPFEPLSVEESAALDAAADRVDVELVQTAVDDRAPGRLVLELRLARAAMRCVVEIHNEPDTVPYFLMFEGPDLAAYPPAVRHAIERIVYSAKPGVSPQ